MNFATWLYGWMRRWLFKCVWALRLSSRKPDTELLQSHLPLRTQRHLPMRCLIWVSDLRWDCVSCETQWLSLINFTDASEVNSFIKVFLSLFPDPKGNPNLNLIFDSQKWCCSGTTNSSVFGSSEFNSKQHMFIKYLLSAKNVDWSYRIWAIKGRFSFCYCNRCILHISLSQEAFSSLFICHSDS